MSQRRTVRSGRAAVAIVSALVVACSAVESSDIAATSSTTSIAQATTTLATVSATEFDEDLLAEQLAGITVPEGKGAVMVAVVDPGGEVYYLSKGSDPAGKPLTPDAVFRVGSITKMFTAALTLTLVEEGTVDLDAEVTDYLTRVAVPAGVTVRDLLQHTSGIPDYVESPASILFKAVNDPERVWSPEEAVALVEDMPPLFQPGARFSYSNTNYTILGVLVEEVTGLPFAAALRARILDRLGLDATYLASFEEGQEPFGAYTTRDSASEPIDFPYTAVATSVAAAGGLVSSVEDLHTLLSALFDGKVISADLVAAMTANEEYGFGIGRRPDFENVYGHGGGVPGYWTRVLHAPDTGKTAFWVATNDNSIFDPPIEQLAPYFTNR